MRHAHDADQVDVHHPLPERLVAVLEEAELVRAGVVHEQRERPERGLRRRNRILHRRRVAHVHQDRLAVHLGRDLTGSVEVHVADRDPRTLGGQPPAGGGTDAAGAPGHEHGSVLESHPAAAYYSRAAVRSHER